MRRARSDQASVKVLVASGVRMDWPSFPRNICASWRPPRRRSFEGRPRAHRPNRPRVMKKPANDNFESFAADFKKASNEAASPSSIWSLITSPAIRAATCTP